MQRLMLLQFLRTRTCQFGLLLGLILGVMSIVTGKQFLMRQDTAMAQVAENQKEHINRNVDFHGKDIGLLFYYLKFAVVNEHDAMAALAIGQKDLNPSIQQVKILGLEGQKYNTDLVNPNKLLHGNLDLSFVLVYVFPLLIIGFTYNLRSEEEETGTWKIVSVMSNSNLKFLWSKLLVRLAILVLLMGLLYLMASLVLSIPFNLGSLAFFVTGLFYIFFWFSLSFWIISLKRNSNFNALILLSFWLVMVIVLPAIANNYITNKYPVPEALTAMIKQRDGYHKKWDLEKKGTMEKFYSLYPQFEKYGFPAEEGFNWLWYYAMQHLGDAESQKETNNMLDKIIQREEVSRQWAMFAPAMHTQLAFNELAGTSLVNHLNLMKGINDFHEEKRLYIYPKIFSESDVDEVDWQEFEPKHFHHKDKSTNWLLNLIPLFAGIMIFIGLSMLSIRTGA